MRSLAIATARDHHSSRSRTVPPSPCLACVQERDEKTKRLNALFSKFKEARREIDELQNDFAEERVELQETLEEVQRDLKLRQLIIEHFVPPGQLQWLR